MINCKNCNEKIPNPFWRVQSHNVEENTLTQREKYRCPACGKFFMKETVFHRGDFAVKSTETKEIKDVF